MISDGPSILSDARSVWGLPIAETSTDVRVYTAKDLVTVSAADIGEHPQHDRRHSSAPRILAGDPL